MDPSESLLGEQGLPNAYSLYRKKWNDIFRKLRVEIEIDEELSVQLRACVYLPGLNLNKKNLISAFHAYYLGDISLC